MFTIKSLPEFAEGLDGLKDGLRASVWRIAWLGGGDKHTQSADFAKAVKLAARIEE